MRKLFTLIAAMAALGMLATSAFAYEAGDNIGKGEVQNYFGMNNKTFQAEAAGKSLSAREVTESTWWCDMPGSAPNLEKSTNVRTSTTATLRDNKTGQITGYTVTGSNTVTQGLAPGSCPGGEYIADSLQTGATDSSFLLQ